MSRKRNHTEELIWISQKETHRLISKVYDDLFDELSRYPEQVWEDEKLAKRIGNTALFEEMVEAYLNSEEYEKAAKVQTWIDRVNSSQALINVKKLIE